MAWKRQAARVVVTDPASRIFLQHGSDPVDPTKGTWWELPGGGIDSGESSEEAVRRELWEECGFTDVTVGEILWRQHVEFRFAGIDFDQHEVIHRATVPVAEEWSPQALEALEVLAFRGARWWEPVAIVMSRERFIPDDLVERLQTAGLA